jgi:hypothetical protein
MAEVVAGGDSAGVFSGRGGTVLSGTRQPEMTSALIQKATSAADTKSDLSMQVIFHPKGLKLAMSAGTFIVITRQDTCTSKPPFFRPEINNFKIFQVSLIFPHLASSGCCSYMRAPIRSG